VRVLVQQDPEAAHTIWTAHLLEADIAGFGYTPLEALQNLQYTILDTVHFAKENKLADPLVSLTCPDTDYFEFFQVTMEGEPVGMASGIDLKHHDEDVVLAVQVEMPTYAQWSQRLKREDTVHIKIHATCHVLPRSDLREAIHA